MKLKEINYESTYTKGYGAGSGSMDTTEYECPCGKGKVVYEKDNTPGFRDWWVRIECDQCHEKYVVDRNAPGIELIEKD